MADPARSGEIVGRLREMGVKTSIDDFGAGYSSLSYLKQLQVDELKIDRSFVVGITPRSDEVAIVRSAIDLGHSLGLRVIAEGVETEVAWDILTELGCDAIQGFLITRPLPARLLVPFSRLGPYDRGLLDRLAFEDKTLFHYFAHAASLVLTEDFQIHSAAMRSYATRTDTWGGRIHEWMAENHALREQIMEQIGARGPLRSRDFENTAR